MYTSKAFQFALLESLPLSSPLCRPLCFRHNRDNRRLAAGRLPGTHHSSHQPRHRRPQLLPHALTSRCSVLHPRFCIFSLARPHCRRTLSALCSLSSSATDRHRFRVPTTFKRRRRPPGTTQATTMSSKPLNCPVLSSLLCCFARDRYCQPLAIRRHQPCH